nr:metal ABC transporter ATP-binding protein [Shuttleworthia satelles]
MDILTCRDLTLGYGEQILVEKLNFQLPRGAYLCIVGENGAGKSTLMRTLLKLQEPLSGRIWLDEEAAASGIGYLPQQTQTQRDFPASVREIVLSGCQARGSWHPFYTQEEKERAHFCMRRLDICQLKDCSYRKLSGGQQQRVLLARALAATDQVLLLDEPVTGLDPKATLSMYELVEKLHREGISVIMISHDVRAAAENASHILYLGDQVFFGSSDAFAKSSIGQYYLSKGGRHA